MRETETIPPYIPFLCWVDRLKADELSIEKLTSSGKQDSVSLALHIHLRVLYYNSSQLCRWSSYQLASHQSALTRQPCEICTLTYSSYIHTYIHICIYICTCTYVCTSTNIKNTIRRIVIKWLFTPSLKNIKYVFAEIVPWALSSSGTTLDECYSKE